MFLQSGGGGKGIRPSQQQHQHHLQSTHHHHNTLAQQQVHQQQQQQQQLSQAQQTTQAQHHTVFISQQSAANHSHLPLSHVQSHQQQQLHQQSINQQQTSQNPLQTQQLIFYANPPHTTQFTAAPPPGNNVGAHQATVHMAGTSPPVQVSSNTSLVGSNGTPGSLTPSGSNTSLVRNSAMQQYTTAPTGLIQAQSPTTAPGGATYMTTAYLPYNTSAVLTAAATAAVAFNANGNNGTAPAPSATSFYQTAQPGVQQQKQISQQATMHHSSTPAPIAFYHTSSSLASSNSSTSTQRPPVRSVISAPSPHQNPRQNGTQHTPPTFFAYAVPTAQSTRGTLMNNNPNCAPILAQRNTTIGGHTTYLPSPFCTTSPIGINANSIPAGSHILTPAGMNPAQPRLQTFATHMPPGAVSVNTSHSATTLAPSIPIGEKLKERKHAIPIIHPITHENVLDPKSTTFTKKESLSISNKLKHPPGIDPPTQPAFVKTTESLESSVVSDKEISLPIYNVPISTKTYSPSPLPCTGKMDQQMQTEKPTRTDELSNESDKIKEKYDINNCENLDMVNLLTSKTSDIKVSSDTVGSKDRLVTVAVNDLVEETEDCISFISAEKVWSSNNEEESLESLLNSQSPAENIDLDIKTQYFVPTQRHNEQIKENNVIQPLKENDNCDLQHRPKLANKQNTATPISIANAAAEAATGSVITLTAKPQPHKIALTLSPDTQLGIEEVPVSVDLAIKCEKQTHLTDKISENIKSTPATSVTSSTASTPTHQQQNTMKNAVGKSNNIGVGYNNGASKRNRKSQKRTKDNQKKQKSLPITSNTNKNTFNANYNTSTPTSLSVVPTSNQTDTNIFSNSSSIGSSSREIQQLQPNSESIQGITIINSKNVTKTPIDVRLFCRVTSTADDTLSESTTGSSTSITQSDKHLAAEEIVAKFLLTSTPHNNQEELHQIQFLNSSSSACEEEEFVNSSNHRTSEDNNSSLSDLKFGDFAEEKDFSDQTVISSSTWTSSLSNSTQCSTKTIKDYQLKKLPTDTIDAEPNINYSTKNSVKTSQGSSVPKINNRPQTLNTAKSFDSSKRIKYTIEELKDMSRLNESRKPPMVLCQKGDCISQLFVSRQQHHISHNQSVIGLHQHLQQQYQHMNFNESVDFVSGKRRGQGKKHHDQQMNSGCGTGSVGGSQRNLDIIRVHLSLKEEIKLSECENAWQPETLRRISIQNQSNDCEDLEAVLKKVRGILNKLTPDNFDVLLKTMSSISMNTYEKMQQVMLLIFEKTVSEPNFAPTYAKFCKVLFHEIKAENKSLFTSSLITRVQHEFESNVNDANAKALKLQPIVDKLEDCSNINKRAELQAELEDQEYQFRRRAWGTVRFIGELYKLQSLTSDRVLICIESLLEHGCEEKLEYMCKLLTTVGHLLEGTAPEQYSNNVRIDKIFRKIQEIVHKSRNVGSKSLPIKISSRVRFMMQDVMDLRARNWDQPTSHSGNQNRHRHINNLNSKHDDKTHVRVSSSNNIGAISQHQQHRHMPNSRYQDSHCENNNYFMQKLQKNHQDHPAVSIDYTKLRFSSEESTQSTPKLGNSSNYIWRNIGNRPVATPTSNVALLKRSTANQSSHYIHCPSQQSMSTAKSSTCSNASVDSVIDIFSAKECKDVLNRLAEEALNTRQWKDEVLNIWREYNMKQQVAIFHCLLTDYLHLCTVRRPQRLAIASIFSYLMRQKVFDKPIFTQAYSQFGDEFPDLLVDVPNGWTYVFEFLGPILYERLLHFNDIWQCQWLDDAYFTERFVKAFLNYFITEFGMKYTRELWHKEYKLDRGQIFWADPSKFRDFINNNGFNFIDLSIKQQQHYNSLHSQQRLNSIHSHSTLEQVERIKFLLNATDDCDMAIDYITTNVNINTNVIRHLTKFLCCDYSLTVMSRKGHSTRLLLNTQLFRRKCTPILRLCLDGREALELSCLDEIVVSLQQHFLVESNDETAANDAIYSIFSTLYDCEVIPKESFEKWYRTEMDQMSSLKSCRQTLTDELRNFIKKLL